MSNDREGIEIEETDGDLCRALWMAVIVQAVMDARSRSRDPVEVRARAQALSWLAEEDGDSDFAEVCELAGLEPSRVRKAVRQFLRQDCGPSLRCLAKSRPPRGRAGDQPSTKEGEQHDEEQRSADQYPGGLRPCRCLAK